jgi:hypothetical protein
MPPSVVFQKMTRHPCPGNQGTAENGRGTANLGRVLRKWHEIGSEGDAWSASVKNPG